MTARNTDEVVKPPLTERQGLLRPTVLQQAECIAVPITADKGESLGVRNKLWKKGLQTPVNQERLTITVAHDPPTTVPHGTRSSIASILSFPSGLRANPLTSLETVIELISHTTTNEGWQVTALKDSQCYPKVISVPDAELSALNLVRDVFHGEWNSPIKPFDT